jgi:NAD(P)H-dependent FMN reductase
MLRIGIIVGTTRPGRKAPAVAEWVLVKAVERDDAVFELVDIADYDLPLLDEPNPAATGRYEHLHTRDWAARIASFDGFIFVTPEYNHSIPGSLKNAIDFAFREWNDKAAGFVGYGGAGGVRAVEQLRQMMGALKVADVGATVALTLAADFEGGSEFRPADRQESALAAMVDQLLGWAAALKSLRGSPQTPARDGDASPGSGNRVLILGRSAEVQREIVNGLDELELPSLDVQTSTDVDSALTQFDASDFDLIVFGRGIVGPISHRLRRAFAERNPSVHLLDAWSPAAVRQISAAVNGSAAQPKVDATERLHD